MGRLLRAFVVCWAIPVLACVGCGPAQRPSGANVGVTPTTAAKRVYTREEFKGLVVGKTKEQVLAAVGKPDSTQDFGGETWYFYKATSDPTAGKVDASAQLVWKNGVVSAVNFV